MRPVVCLVFLLIAYLFLLGDLSRVIENRPTSVKLGYVPSFAVVDSFAGDQKLSIAALYTFKAIIYYGEMIQQWQAGHRHPPEFDNLFGFLSSSIHLDPYNMDLQGRVSCRCTLVGQIRVAAADRCEPSVRELALW